MLLALNRPLSTRISCSCFAQLNNSPCNRSPVRIHICIGGCLYANQRFRCISRSASSFANSSDRDIGAGCVRWCQTSGGVSACLTFLRHSQLALRLKPICTRPKVRWSAMLYFFYFLLLLNNVPTIFSFHSLPILGNPLILVSILFMTQPFILGTTLVLTFFSFPSLPNRLILKVHLKEALISPHSSLTAQDTRWHLICRPLLQNKGQVSEWFAISVNVVAA